MFLQVIIKNMGWNLVGPVVRCLLWKEREDDDKRKVYFLILDLLVKDYPCGVYSTKSDSVMVVQKSIRQGIAQPLHWEVGLDIAKCCKALIEFTKPFVEEVIDNKENSLENEKLKDELLKFFKMEGPRKEEIMYIKRLLTEIQGADSSTGQYSDSGWMGKEWGLGGNAYIGLNEGITGLEKSEKQIARKKRTWNYLEFEEEEDKQLADSMASLAYLIFVQGICIDQLPMVLSPLYLLQLNMGHIEVFLQRGKRV
ncbi:hypothetical protein P7K49_016533 [Saguinus oedipus]|uniref:Uncharacterized protein n=1 Tax=Saguinus oedipus TaxID=9490 RepID=A0ABQ9VDN5_SAGOE|nr:hypothetical protein P7K49_016533 [Saguinus oedipus]